jgi:murein DD-endopeptidase MepM/ murein hydrolase activator NlpD
LAKIQKEEDSLYELILSLESRKKDISQKYISTLENKNLLEEKLENALAQNKVKKSTGQTNFSLDIDFDIMLPLKKFSDYQGGKEGVTFKYDSIEPLIACANGRVEYSGELASYGKVIILDHGKDIRSVILGEISSKVQKGQEVRQGQIIGYTIAKPGTKKSLYYEIRKKNKVQNTLAWLKKANNKLL